MFSAQAMHNVAISLEIMGLGMAGIFTVILAIMLVVTLLVKIGSRGSRD